VKGYKKDTPSQMETKSGQEILSQKSVKREKWRSLSNDKRINSGSKYNIKPKTRAPKQIKHILLYQKEQTQIQ
jgi:hypothetical protein